MEEVQKNVQVNPRFVANYCFDKNLVSKEQIMSLFDYGIAMIDWHENEITKKEGEKSIIEVHSLKNLKKSREQMLEFKSQSSVTETESGFVLSYPINVVDADFEEISESGCRPWLRNYLEDFFMKYVGNGMSFFALKMCVEKKDSKDLETLQDAYDKAMKKAYYKKSEGFWIDGE